MQVRTSLSMYMYVHTYESDLCSVIILVSKLYI